MDMGLIVTFVGLGVAGMAGVLGVWMDRDRDAPPKWAWVFSGLILIATGVEISHSVVQASEDGALDEKMASVLEKLTVIAEKGGNPALSSFVNSELAAQARNNPEVMAKVEKKVAARGGDQRHPPQGRGRPSHSEGLPARRPGAAGAPPRGKGLVAGTGGKGPVAGKAGGKTGGKAGRQGRCQQRRRRHGQDGQGKAAPPVPFGPAVPSRGQRPRRPSSGGDAGGSKSKGKAAREGLAWGRPRGPYPLARPTGAALRLPRCRRFSWGPPPGA